MNCCAKGRRRRSANNVLVTTGQPNNSRAGSASTIEDAGSSKLSVDHFSHNSDFHQQQKQQHQRQRGSQSSRRDSPPRLIETSSDLLMDSNRIPPMNNDAHNNISTVDTSAATNHNQRSRKEHSKSSSNNHKSTIHNLDKREDDNTSNDNDPNQHPISLLQTAVNLSRSRISSFRQSSNYNDIHANVRKSFVHQHQNKHKLSIESDEQGFQEEFNLAPTRRMMNKLAQRKNGTERGQVQGEVGLMNLGNTCFLNSSLQCLSHTIPLTDYFLGYKFRKEINDTNVLGTKGVLAEAYAALMTEIWIERKTVVKPIQLKRHLESFAPQFVGTRQQDAQEVLAYLLDGIHEDLNRVPKKPYIEDVEGNGANDEGDSIKAWHNYLLRDKSVIVDIFQGQLRNTLTCTKCSHRSVKFDPFMYLSVPIMEDQRNVTLDDCLELFCKEELLTEENQWYCPKCKEHVDVIKKFDLWTLPPILIVHLKRFKHHTFPATSARAKTNTSTISWMSRGNSYYPRSRVTKMNQKVNYPIRNWKPSIALSRTVKEPSYDLYAVSNHYGGFGSGHYTAYAMNRIDDEWYEFNDSNTRQISESDVEKNSNAAYLLFYNLTDRSPNQKVNGDHSVADSADSESFISRVPVIYQQSISRPEYWPHHKTADNDQSLRLYRRPQSGQSKIRIAKEEESDDEVYIEDHKQIFEFR